MKRRGEGMRGRGGREERGKEVTEEYENEVGLSLC